MIQTSNLVKYHGSTRVLDGIEFSVRKGETAVLIGPSGGGKSTFLRCINGLESFNQGEIRVGDLRLSPESTQPRHAEMLRRLRSRVGMVFQQFNLFANMTVLENVAAGPLYALGRPRAEAEADAEMLLARVGLADKKNSKPSQLSGGQQQRVAIARALAVKPEAILFDEPTSALDPRNAAEVLKVMTELAADGMTMITVTHAMNFARNAATTIHVMQSGRVIESGPPAKIFASENESTRHFLAEAAG